MPRESRSQRGRIPGSTIDWRALGRDDDVLYQVCSWEQKKGSWTEEDFYESGRSDWEDLIRHWTHYEPNLGGTCVEIGCGPGRVTRQLAGSFRRVVGLDVSADLLERARKVVPDNVELNQVDSTEIPLDAGTVDAVFSIYVFIHLETVEIIRDYLASAFRVLRPGGTIMVNFWMAGPPQSLRTRIRNATKLARSRRRIARGASATAVRITTVPVGDFLAMTKALGFGEIEFRLIPTRYTGHSAWFCFARKPAD